MKKTDTFEFSDDAARRILRDEAKKVSIRRELAVKLDCTEAQLSGWMNGKSMSRGTIHRILATFDPKYWNKHGGRAS